jgi:integron integrase
MAQPNPKTPRLLEQVRDALRLRHASPRTIDTYQDWIRRFVLFHGSRHPKTMGDREVNEFLSDLATRRNVAASTQNQALAALLFLFRNVLGLSIDVGRRLVRAKRPHRRPNVISREDVSCVLDHIEGRGRIAARLMYGCGLRVSEVVSLRIKDVSLNRREIIVREGKGGRDRVTMLPEALVAEVTDQIDRVRRLRFKDAMRGHGFAMLPESYRKKSPASAADWRWMWLFPAARLYREAETRHLVRHHLDVSVVQRAVREAGARSGIAQRVTTHTLRHCFATHLLESGYDIRTVQELMGHRDVSTTMIYTHVLNRGGLGVRSPLDVLNPPGRPPHNSGPPQARGLGQPPPPPNPQVPPREPPD